MTEQKQKFLATEYETLRQEIEVISKELRDTEKQTVLINAAIWTWFATHGKDVPAELHRYVWWLPVMIVVFGFVRFFGVQQTLLKIARYIRETIEPQLLGQGQGWENFLSSKPMKWKVAWWISSYLTWLLLIVASLFVAVIMTY